VCGNASDDVAAMPIRTEFIKLAAAYDEAQRGAIEEVSAGWKVRDVTQYMTDSLKKQNLANTASPATFTV